ncbi:uncharacterized protein LOC112158552 [Oryzias melastigma]|uniref:uncharacterized protein LOC112158552 n=1 Tax=Oryzias melastigma TaxID=30732 RepID=UPI000CF7DC69|nr:uncharacterized protein LOC112158552 [Oryzias melastigma]XP_024147766.1 uncharacterized protein LOC112158552 [Oryzias melastigma]XP_024147767.1 uncharacterized protein LOC112158552 [Oryzias melastigma]
MAKEEKDETVVKKGTTGLLRLFQGRSRRNGEEDEKQEKLDNRDETSKTALSVAEKLEPTDRDQCEDPGEGNNTRTRARHRWCHRFSSAVVCMRRRKSSLKKPQEELKTASLNEVEGDMAFKVNKRFNMKTKFSRFLTSNIACRSLKRNGDKTGRKALRSLPGKLSRFFLIREKRRSITQENVENKRVEEDPAGFDVQADESIELQKTTVPPQSTEDDIRRKSQTGLLDADNLTNNRVSVQVESPEEDLCDSVKVVVDFGDQQSSQQKTNQTNSWSLQSSINGPSIRIELCPPVQDEEEEECWASGSYSSHVLHLPGGFNPSERQLHHTARSLVQTAMTAAVDQLTREKQMGRIN